MLRSLRKVAAQNDREIELMKAEEAQAALEHQEAEEAEPRLRRRPRRINKRQVAGLGKRGAFCGALLLFV